MQTRGGHNLGLCSKHLFFSLGDHSRSLHITIVASRLPNLDRHAIGSRCDCENPRGLAARDFWARPPLRVRIQGEISSRLLCPHVDSSPGIRLIVHFSKSVAPLAIFFLQMYLGAPSEAGIRMVSRMHYREQHCRIQWELEINYREGRGSLWRHQSHTIHRCGGARS